MDASRIKCNFCGIDGLEFKDIAKHESECLVHRSNTSYYKDSPISVFSKILPSNNVLNSVDENE
jgi:hypothetical protein